MSSANNNLRDLKKFKSLMNNTNKSGVKWKPNGTPDGILKGSGLKRITNFNCMKFIYNHGIG